MYFIDFGLMQHILKQDNRSIDGTLLYMAPNVLSSYSYDNCVGLWSIRVILC
ncbi:unnamed protein product, partial [Rotaria sp. Silwood2]